MKPVWSTIITSVVTVAILSAPVVGVLVLDRDKTPVVDVTPVDPSDCPDDTTPDNVRRVVVGEMIVLSGEGDKVSWTCVPETPDRVTYGDKNQFSAMSFRKNGTYNVVVASYSGDAVTIKQIKIIVGPFNPDTPIVPDIPEVIKSPWQLKIESWLGGDVSEARKADAKALADSFRSVAGVVQSRLDENKLISVNDMIAMTVTANRDAIADSNIDWGPFRVKMAAEFEQLAKDGKLETMVDHITEWNKIADALEKVAS